MVVAPSRNSRKKFLSDIDKSIRSAKSAIAKLGTSGQPRRAERAYAQALKLLDDKIRGWGDAHIFCDQRLPFHQMDEEIDQRLKNFGGWMRGQIGKLDSRGRRRALGIALLGDTPKKGKED